MLSPYDGLSIGILSALKSGGYGTAGQPYPIVTGQDAEVASVKSIIAGEQYSTIHKDTRELAKVAVEDGGRGAEGRQAGDQQRPRTTRTARRSCPRSCCEPVIVDKSNYKKVLIDSGYYTEDQLR